MPRSPGRWAINLFVLLLALVPPAALAAGDAESDSPRREALPSLFTEVWEAFVSLILPSGTAEGSSGGPTGGGSGDLGGTMDPDGAESPGETSDLGGTMDPDG